MSLHRPATPSALAGATLALALALALAAAPAHAADRPPSLRAVTAILVQPDTGDVVLARGADRERPVASTTKLMTALLTLEHAPLGAMVPAAAYHGAPAESIIGLRAGERLTVRDLLRGLLLASGNDAALTLADRVGGSEAAFVRLMNRRARQLGLHHTHYANPIGLDAPGNFSTARDLVTLASVALRLPFFAETVNLPSALLRSGAHERHIVNRNALVREVPWVDGVKTGHTQQAGYVLVGAARRDGVRMLSAVLGDPSEAARDADTLALLRFGLHRYRDTLVLRAGRVLARPRLAYRDARVAVVAARDLRHVVRRGERAAVTVQGVPGTLDGPLPRGAREGSAVVRLRGRVVARVALVTAAPVAEATLGTRAAHFLSNPVTLGLVVLVAACSLQLAVLRRRATRRRRGRRERRHGTEVA